MGGWPPNHRPITHSPRSIFVDQFGDHGRRHEHLAVEFGKNVDLADGDQIADRGRIRDGDHCRDASRIAAMSRSRSSIV